jgi:4-amino-4-deoxy-L-arabinose transferase-like glycosyltransferase
MSKIITKHKFLIILGLIFIILRLPSLFEPYWYGDEGIYLTLGQAIRKGLTLYSQIHDNKPPSLYYLAAIGQTVFGFRLLLFLIMIPTVCLFYKLSLQFFNQKISWLITFFFLVLTSIPFIEGNIANAEIFMLLPTIAGFLLFLTAKKRINYFWSGIFLGLAFTIKVPVIIEFGFLFLWLIISKFTDFKKQFKSLFFDLLTFGVAFILPISLFGVYFAVKGAFTLFLSSALLQNFSYLSSWATGIQTASVSSGGLFSRLIILLIFWSLVFFLKIKKIIDSKLSFILFWFGATIFGSLLSTRPYPHYLIQILPPFSLLIPLAFNFKNIKNQILIFICFLSFFLVTKKYQFYYYPIFSYYQAFYFSGSINKFHQYFGGDIQATYKISQYIDQNSSLNDRIFIWGDLPYIYALSNRLPPGRYTVAYHIVDFNGYSETMSAIKAFLPKIIIYHPMENRQFEQLDKFVNDYYYIDDTIGSNLIFKLR